ncbi:hypothetical protein QR680_017655 [Steinernema hermaphroditum]|uniref:Uncharacterized protein n=1 Tax=Steinernema hermaphroditum TaxID=289476 RepID=A0AA39HHE2_9BILA|nr:hypothetical protein QR680_017655 [Steinernema hermaphroditum]
MDAGLLEFVMFPFQVGYGNFAIPFGVFLRYKVARLQAGILEASHFLNSVSRPHAAGSDNPTVCPAIVLVAHAFCIALAQNNLCLLANCSIQGQSDGVFGF